MSGPYNTSAFTKLSETIYITKTGRIENCRKIEQGLPCSRHEPISKGAYHNQISNRVSTKLSRFERNAMKLFSLISKTPMGKVKEEYIQRVARYSIEGVRIPSKNEINALEKTFLEISELSPDTKTSKIKKWLKNMTLGEGFTAAGFWGMRDMMKRSLLRVKNFFTGGILASTLFLTSCAPGATPQTTQQEQVIEEEVEVEAPAVDEEELAFLFEKPHHNDSAGIATNKSGRELSPKEGVYEYTDIQTVSDEHGSYQKVIMNISEPYIEETPMFYTDNRPITNFTEEEVQDAVRFYANFALNETIDSIAADNQERYMEWWDTVGSNVFHEDLHEEMVSNFVPWDTELGKPVIYKTPEHTYENNLPGILMVGALWGGERGWTETNMIRDGESRLMDRHINELELTRSGHDSIYIQSRISYGTVYSYDDYFQTVYPASMDFTYDNGAFQDADEWHSQFYEQGNKWYEWQVARVGYNLTKSDDGWKITGYSLEYLPYNYETVYKDATGEEITDYQMLEAPHEGFDEFRHIGLVVE